MICNQGHEEEMKMNLEEQRQFILNGNMYNDLSDELVEAREKTVFLTNEYNASFGKPAEEREAILKKLLRSIGKGVHFEPNFRCEFGYNISIGNNFYANFDCIMLNGGGIEIGDNVFINACCHFQDHGGVTLGDGCQIGHNVVFATLDHGLAPEDRHTTYPAPIMLGRNVWVGSNSTILQGVTIGDNAVVAAGAVVTKDVPAYTVVAGCPAKAIKRIK